MSEAASQPAPAPKDDVKGMPNTTPATPPKPATTTDANTSQEDMTNGASTSQNAAETGKAGDTEMKDNATESPSGPAGTAEPTSSKKDGKRKSTSGVPEHKSKKATPRRKSEAVTQLGAEPGNYYWARMKGYPEWPSIIASEDMLPESLLVNRPVSTKRPDGTYREDYADGGKNVKDRTYPIMFLGTNEFCWMPNTSLSPLDLDNLKEPTKKTKQLAEAYEVARLKEGLDYFKNMLYEHQKAQQEWEAELERKEAEKEAKKAKKAEKADKPAKSAKPRKSKGAAEDVDEEMADAADDAEPKADASAKKSKPTKKRKKDAAEGDEEAEGKKPAKNLKVKLNASTNGESTPKTKQTKKPKAKPETPKLSAKEIQEQRHKQMMYLRHKLQKGFLTRDQPPKEEEMDQMGDFFNNLEAQKEVDGQTLRETKVHKVLKAIVKLTSIPREEEFRFKKRSMDLLTYWRPLLSEDNAAAGPKSDVKEPNGEKADDSKDDEEEEKADISMTELGERPATDDATKDKSDKTDANKESEEENSGKTEAPAETNDTKMEDDSEPKTEAATT